MRYAVAIEELAGPLSPMQKVNLAREVVVAYVRIRWTLARGNGVPETVEMLRATAPPLEGPLGDDRAEKLAGLRLGRAVGKTLGVLPTDARCLNRSLVLGEPDSHGQESSHPLSSASSPSRNSVRTPGSRAGAWPCFHRAKASSAGSWRI